MYQAVVTLSTTVVIFMINACLKEVSETCTFILIPVLDAMMGL
jgi:hypothetical protein